MAMHHEKEKKKPAKQEVKLPVKGKMADSQKEGQKDKKK